MRSTITRFGIRIGVATGIAFFGINPLDSVIGQSPIERAWALTQETIVKPLRSLAGRSEFKLSEHQQLRKVFLSH